MMRAAVGSWVLVLVFSALVVSSGLWGAAAPGTAVRQPPPAAPPIGACVIGSQAPEIVSCDREHDGEIVLTWHGDMPTTTLDPALFSPEDFSATDPLPHCWQAAEEYLGRVDPIKLSTDATWYRFSVFTNTTVTYGPSLGLVDDWSWRACVVSPTDAESDPTTSVGSLRGVALDPDRALPDAWRPCLARSDESWGSWITCTTPHQAELIGTVNLTLPVAELERLRVEHEQALEEQELSGLSSSYRGPPPVVLSHPVAEQECHDLVEDYLAGPLDNRAGELRTALVFRALQYEGVNGVIDPAVDIPTGVYGECRVEVVGDRDLIGSVAGIGADPLPYG